ADLSRAAARDGSRLCAGAPCRGRDGAQRTTGCEPRSTCARPGLVRVEGGQIGVSDPTWEPVGNPPGRPRDSGSCRSMRADPNPSPGTSPNTWNDSARIAAHRALSPKERLRLTIQASRAALRFARGERRPG